jgi:predicted phage baseplate assembly protein
MVFGQSEFLEMAEEPIEDAISGAATELGKIPDGLVAGQQLVATGKDSVTGEDVNEVVKVGAIKGATITLTLPLTKSYARASFSFNANVAAATHGETVQELLGGGDASAKFQTFKLRQPPLTYISAANASGAASTLEVRVNDLLWHETPTLYGEEAKDHVYIARRDDDGNTTVQFGDGVTGARLPSGQNNIRAKYRKGIGLEGLVKAGQLSMLLSRPLGVKGVANPLDASGAQDPEQLDDARANAPLKVLTLERVVSLIDYENFARAFGGIAKALATWTWDGRSRGVMVTVAGPNGAAVEPGSATFDNLVAAMRAAGDPFVELRVKTFRPAYFRFAGNVKVDGDFESEKVLAAVEQALRDKFSFAARGFGQPVMLSEVISVIQAVPGVVAVDVDKLYRSDSTPSLQQRLLAELPVLSPNGQLPAAELLTIDAAPLDQLGVMA